MWEKIMRWIELASTARAAANLASHGHYELANKLMKDLK